MSKIPERWFVFMFRRARVDCIPWRVEYLVSSREIAERTLEIHQSLLYDHIIAECTVSPNWREESTSHPSTTFFAIVCRHSPHEWSVVGGLFARESDARDHAPSDLQTNSIYRGWLLVKCVVPSVVELPEYELPQEMS